MLVASSAANHTKFGVVAGEARSCLSCVRSNRYVSMRSGSEWMLLKASKGSRSVVA